MIDSFPYYFDMNVQLGGVEVQGEGELPASTTAI
jgi:hypothetical protein